MAAGEEEMSYRSMETRTWKHHHQLKDAVQLLDSQNKEQELNP